MPASVETRHVPDLIIEFTKWLGELSRYGMNWHVVSKGWENEGLDEEAYKFRVHLYTALQQYHIVAVDRGLDDNYLGCAVTSRFPRLGENWRRGNDLPDGKLIRDTWDRIKDSIISYELVKPEPDHTTNTATFENLSLALKGVTAAIMEATTSFSSAGSTASAASSTTVPPPALNIGRAQLSSPQRRSPVETSDIVKEKAIEFLKPILELLPVDKLPEMLVSSDECLRIAAKKRLDTVNE